MRFLLLKLKGVWPPGQWLKVTRRLAAETRTYWQLKEAIFCWRGTNEMRKQQGFSLIELLIVVAIILIIAAIAIPNLLRARIAANEASSVSSIRTINTAEVTYSPAYPTVGYAATLVALGPGAGVQTCPAGGPPSSPACLLDAALANNIVAGGKSGYTVDAIGVVV